jgi:hypothetical protein
MQGDLFIRMVIPIQSQPIVGTTGVIFHHWLPMESDDHLVVRSDDMELSLWFDRSSADHPRGDDPLRLENVCVRRVNAEVRIRNLDYGFIDFILEVSTEPKPEGYPYSERYKELGVKVYDLTLKCVNRLISYIRVEKGQYWLEELEIDPGRMASAFIWFKAVCSRDREQWFNWRPTSSESAIVVMTSKSSWVEREDWSSAAVYVRSKSRSNFVYDLLRTALANAWSGRRRTALVEAVTALEVAISEFAKSPLANEAFGKTLAGRMDTDSLKAQVDHMGNSGTIKYLFPVIFPEDQLPNDLLKACQKAVEERNNVVHNGQRDVGQKKVLNYVISIERLCGVLRGYTCRDQHDSLG